MSIKKQLRVEYRPVGQLKPAAKNPRTHSAEQVGRIAKLITTLGWTNPILVDGKNGLIAGHGRLAAAKSLGLKEVPVIELAGLSLAEKRAYILADNKVAGAGIDLDLTGFNLDEIEQLTAHKGGGKTDPDEIPPVPEEPTSRLGDLWRMGEHRVLAGDALEAKAWERLVGGIRVDLAITSPPYNVGIKYSTHKDRAPRDAYLDFIRAVGEQLAAHLAPGRFVAWNVGVSPKTYPAHQVVALEAIGLSFYRQIVWEKAGVPYPTFQTTMRKKAARHYKPNYKHELIHLLERDAKVVLDQDTCPLCEGDGHVPRFDANLQSMHETVQLLTNAGEPKYGDTILPDPKYSSDVWKIAQMMATPDLATTVKEHPAAYPVELPRALMTFLTARGEVVVDPFGGSGSTAIAAEQLGRRAYLMDIDPRYVDVMVRRWQDFTGKKATHEGKGKTFDELASERASKPKAKA